MTSGPGFTALFRKTTPKPAVKSQNTSCSAEEMMSDFISIIIIEVTNLCVALKSAVILVKTTFHAMGSGLKDTNRSARKKSENHPKGKRFNIYIYKYNS